MNLRPKDRGRGFEPYAASLPKCERHAGREWSPLQKILVGRAGLEPATKGL
jgi:hypothetical protein